LYAIVKALLSVAFFITAAKPEIALAMRRLMNWLKRNERADESDELDHWSNELPRVGQSLSAALGRMQSATSCVLFSEAQNSCSIPEE